jgi:hypothetical protein
MLLHTPYYIILGEFFIAMAIALLARRVRRGNLAVSLAAGAAGGVAVFIGYAVAYALTDGIWE